MKILGFIFLFLFGIFFSVPFKMIDTTKQNVIGGRMESGRSVVFQFKMVAKKPSTKLHFEDVWIGVKHYSIEAVHQKADNSISPVFEKGDTIYFQAIERYLPNTQGDLEIQESGSKKVPIEYTGQALIGYKFKDKQHYYTIENFDEILTVELP